jgi:hypothetical protein
MQQQNSPSMGDRTRGEDATMLAALVQGRLGGRVAAFQLLVEKQGLVLRGKTRSYYAKQLAQQAVMEATSVPIVANEIEVV